MINNKILTGETLLKLCVSYVEAINKGAVPCIESAWKYVCQFEAEKHIKELSKEYTRKIKEFLTSKPTDNEGTLISNFKDFSEGLKEHLIKTFHKVQIGESAFEYDCQL